MTREEQLLAKLAEECGELTQRAMKALEYGLDHSPDTNTPPNKELIVQEFNDIYAVMILLHDNHCIDIVADWDLIEKKGIRVEHYLGVSKSLGKLDNTTNESYNQGKGG